MGESDSDDPLAELDFGEEVFDSKGNMLGTVRGFSEEGFFVTNRTGMAAMGLEHVRSGQAIGEAELMWRCLDCGEVGDIEEWPGEACPGCGAPKESLYYWTED